MTYIEDNASFTSWEFLLRHQIQRYLEFNVYENATFLCERLYNEYSSEENLHLLATCYYRSGHYNRVHSVLLGSHLPKNRYLFSLCCYNLGKLQEAEHALLQETDIGDYGPEKCEELLLSEFCPVPHGALGIHLLGEICRKSNRRDHAIVFYRISLKKDSFLWQSYQALCDLGEQADPSFYFKRDPNFLEEYLRNSFKEVNLSPSSTKFSALRSCETPIESTEAYSPTPTLEEKHSRVTQSPLDSTDSRFEGISTPIVQTIDKKETLLVKPKKTSSRLFSNVKDRNNDQRDKEFPLGSRLSFSGGLSQNTIRPEKYFKGGEVEVSNWKVEVCQTILNLLYSFGSAYYKISQYKCEEALDLLAKLPLRHRESGWAFNQFGRCYYEMSEYSKAKQAFEKMHRIEPHRMSGLAIYSTTLWHLKKEIDLSYLAQEVGEFDQRSCEAWCVIGNSYSMQKDHETALKFFHRATQLDPTFTYAYTLSGHEYVANEDFDKAIACYRHALRTDSRHYNAWYGLGTIFFRQEKFDLAEYHFRRAIEIHPRSSLLYCYLGMVLHSRSLCDEAIAVLEKASLIQPTNLQVRYQRANILLSQERCQEALEELLVVRDGAPRESSVYFLMGKVCKKMGNVEEAMRHFTSALYFHPKDNNMIKLALDRLHDADVDEDDRI